MDNWKVYIDPRRGFFTVTVEDNEGKLFAILECNTEEDARKLRDAIRKHARGIWSVHDYTNVKL